VAPSLARWIRETGITCLFHEVTTAYNYRRCRLLGLFKVAILTTMARVRLFEIAGNNKFELPSTPFPQIVDAWNPTSGSVGRRRSRICMWYALKDLRISK
jgi:hypothetical protein